MPSIRLFFLVKEPKKLLQLRCEAQPPPSPPYHKEGLHLSFVFPPLREGKKQEMACHLLLRFGIAGRRDVFFKSPLNRGDLGGSGGI